MSDNVRQKRWGFGKIATIAMSVILAAPVCYQFAYYLTYRSVVDSFGLGNVSFPDHVARPFFQPAQRLDAHLGLGESIRKFSRSLD